MSDRIELGAFTVGEKPFPLTYTFTTASGTPVDLTGYTAEFHWAVRSSSSAVYESAVTKPAVVTNPTGGVVSYTWDGTEFMTPGRYAGIFWVGNGVNRLASELHTWTVCLPVDDPPLI